MYNWSGKEATPFKMVHLISILTHFVIIAITASDFHANCIFQCSKKCIKNKELTATTARTGPAKLQISRSSTENQQLYNKKAEHFSVI